MTDKITVRPNGDFMMQDPTTGEEIQAYGESTVTRSAWVEQQIANGKLLSDTKIDKDNLKNPGSEAVPLDLEKQEEKKAPAPQQDDEPTRAEADRGEVRGASKTKNPDHINRVKT